MVVAFSVLFLRLRRRKNIAPRVKRRTTTIGTVIEIARVFVRFLLLFWLGDVVRAFVVVLPVLVLWGMDDGFDVVADDAVESVVLVIDDVDSGIASAGITSLELVGSSGWGVVTSIVGAGGGSGVVVGILSI